MSHQLDICTEDSLRPEASFDSGYSTSPSKFFSVVSPDSAGTSRGVLNMDNKPFMRSPFKGTMQPVLGEEFSIINNFSAEPVSLSPFKESPLSPFRLISQSPSKGSFEEWDKDFLAGFEEKLFGMGDLNELAVEELLKSPQGKALLNRKNSPLRFGGQSAVRKLKISPDSKHPGQAFQPLHMTTAQNINIGQVKQEMYEPFVVKDEQMDDSSLYGGYTQMSPGYGDMTQYQDQTETGDLFGQSMVYANALSAIDPNKMGATPIKPRYTNVGAPKRKLAMKAPLNIQPSHTLLLQNENQEPVLQLQQGETWPSKEKLKYARSKFQEVLNKAVEKELEIIKVERAKKIVPSNSAKNIKVEKGKPIRPGKGKGGGKCGKSIPGKGKGKGVKRTNKKEKYSEIKSALSKTGKSRSTVHQDQVWVQGGRGRRNDDPGWYPDDEEEAEENWDVSPSLYRQTSLGFSVKENDSDDEYIDVGENSLYHYEALVADPTLKVRVLYKM